MRVLRYFLFILLVSSSRIASSHAFVFQPNSGPGRRTTTLLTAPIQAVKALGAAYTYALTHYHLATESATTACLAGVGDLIAQIFVQDATHVNWSRYCSFVVKGSVAGILWSKWYAFCDPLSLWMASSCCTTSSSINVMKLMTSILLEQFIWCPLLYSSWDIPFPMIWRGDALEVIPQQVQATIGPLLYKNAKVWTFANILVYKIPLQWRVVVVSLTDIVWASILSSSIGDGFTSNTEEEDTTGRDRETIKKTIARTDNIVYPPVEHLTETQPETHQLMVKE